MNVTTSPPRPLESNEEEPGPSELDHELELLIKEARARARRRRLGYAATALAAFAGAAAYLVEGGNGGGSSVGAAPDRGRPADVGVRADARLASTRRPYRWVTGALAAHPRDAKILYAATVQGIFKSTDGARTWRRSLEGKGSGTFGAGSVAISPSLPTTVYAVTDRGIFLTRDGGRNWRLTSSGLRQAHALAVDPRRPETVYAATRRGLLKTTDAGRPWRRVGASLPAGVVGAFALDPNDSRTIYAAVSDSANPMAPFDRVFASRDGGGTWRAIRLPPVGGHIHAFSFDPHRPGAVYLSSHYGIHKSLDHGATWQAVNADFMTLDRAPEAPLVFSPAKRGTIYAQTYCEGVFKSTDAGRSWDAMNKGLQVGCRPPYSLTFDARNPETLYVLVPDYGIYRSVDGAQRWELTAQPPACDPNARWTCGG